VTIAAKVFGPTYNIRHVESTIALTSDEHIKAFETKRVDKVLPKAKKLLREFDLIGDVWDSY
jgi:hypothetical protein